METGTKDGKGYVVYREFHDWCSACGHCDTLKSKPPCNDCTNLHSHRDRTPRNYHTELVAEHTPQVPSITVERLREILPPVLLQGDGLCMDDEYDRAVMLALIVRAVKKEVKKDAGN